MNKESNVLSDPPVTPDAYGLLDLAMGLLRQHLTVLEVRALTSLVEDKLIAETTQAIASYEAWQRRGER